MSKSTFGNPDSFAFEIAVEGDPVAELMEVAILVSKARIGGSGAVYLPTFVSELAAFGKCHESTVTSKDFSSLTDEEAFLLLHSVAEEDAEVDGVQPTDVWNYHRLYNLDDAVDGWEIYVFDVGPNKHIVCREEDSKDGNSSNRTIAAVMPRSEFLATIEELVSLLGTSQSGGTDSPPEVGRAKSCHVGIIILSSAHLQRHCNAVFFEFGCQDESGCGGRLISDEYTGGSRQPGITEAQGPELPYPAFHSRQSAMLFKRPWPTRLRQAGTPAMGTTALSSRSAHNSFRALS